MDTILLEKHKKIKKRITQYALSGAILVFISGLPDVYFQIWQNVAVVSAVIIYFLICIYINRKIESKIAGTFISFGGNVITFYSAVVFGELGRAYLFYIPIFIATFLITDYKKRAELIFNISHIMTGIFILFMIDLSFLNDKNIPVEDVIWFGKFNTILALSASIYFLIAFIKEINSNEDRLISMKNELAVKYEELYNKNEELDRLIYSISHDIKAPLSSIEGLINIAKVENTQPALGKYFGRMESSTKRLKLFLENVVNYYKNSKFEIKAESIDFEQEITHILDDLAFMPNFDKIKFSVNVNQLSVFNVDKLRIQTILINLISNAIKYQKDNTEERRVEISVEVDAGKVKIEVLDNGIGIPGPIQDKIFDMFYRGTVKSEGSGLGLFILSETVKKLNGTIQLESQPETFTRFVIEFPA